MFSEGLKNSVEFNMGKGCYILESCKNYLAATYRFDALSLSQDQVIMCLFVTPRHSHSVCIPPSHATTCLFPEEGEVVD